MKLTGIKFTLNDGAEMTLTLEEAKELRKQLNLLLCSEEPSSTLKLPTLIPWYVKDHPKVERLTIGDASCWSNSVNAKG